MPNRYQWFNVKDDKFKQVDRRLIDITVNDLQKVLGQYLFNFPAMQNLDFVVGQIRNIKERTIGAYPELATNKWNDSKGEAFLEKINSAKDNIENMNLIDALERWLGKQHKIPGDKGEGGFISSLYLDKDDKIWKVEDIVNESNHDDFSQSLIYGRPDMKRLQEGFRDAILQKEDFNQAFNDAEVKTIRARGGIEEQSDFRFLEFTLNFGFDINTTIHTKRLRDIFGRQKIVFVNDTKTITPTEKPDTKLSLAGVKTGDMDITEFDPKVEGQSVERGVASGRFIAGGGDLRESDINPGVKEYRAKPSDVEDEYEKDEEGRIIGLERLQEKTEEMEARWKAKRRLDVDVSEILEDDSSDNIKAWVLALWDNKNNTLWQYMKDSGMPLNLTKIGNYSIKFEIKEDLKGRDADKVTLNWTFKQKKSLSEELLMNPAGKSGLYAQKYNLGAGQPETTKIIGPSMSDDKRELETQGFNKNREFLARFVTSRLNTLENAISGSDANEAGDE